MGLSISRKTIHISRFSWKICLLKWISLSIPVQSFHNCRLLGVRPISSPIQQQSLVLASSLDSLTVKQLRELVKQSPERGILSKLKRKQDLIDYLQEKHDPTMAPKDENKRKRESEDKEESSKKKKAPAHQVITERDQIPKLWDDLQAQKNGSYTFRIASWNVAGLRAILDKRPNDIPNLVQKYNIDVLCLQETKLQEQHLDDPKLKIRGHLLEEEGYDAFYTCSVAKKGYAGTAVFIRRRGPGGGSKQTTLKSFFNPEKEKGNEESDLPIDPTLLTPLKVSHEMGKDKHDMEGRICTMDFPLFTLCNVYVPNSGQKLQRLEYRTSEWDKDLVDFMRAKKKQRGLPVIWCGDLNVAHTNLEVWNDGAKHLPKQAGVTPEERASFQEQLDAGFVDAFRKLHGDAKGHYSYWSQRAGNREPNKGLRLDYFVCDPTFFEETSKVIARDCFMIYEQQGSDHCPVVLELEIKP